MQFLLLISLAILGQLSPKPLAPAPPESKSLEKSAYFAFVGRDYIFTLEVVKPGVPLLNFVSMADDEKILLAKNIRMTLENRKAPGRLFIVDTGDPKEPVFMASLTIHRRSSFGVRLGGDFDNAKELLGATIRLGNEDFKLAPLTSFDFENLVLKVNRLNLGSPDFEDDWRVLKLETVGSRFPASR